MEVYRIINRELALYADELACRPRIVVANKCDVPGVEDNIRRLEEEVRKDAIAAAGGNEFADGVEEASRVFKISALTGKGVDSLIHATANKVHELREEAREKQQAEVQYDRIWEHKKGTERPFVYGSQALGRHLPRRRCAYRAHGRADRLGKRRSPGVSAAQVQPHGARRGLIKAGAVNGDKIRIVGRAFEFESADDRVDIYKELDF